MKKRKLTNMPASVHHRLLNLARETKRPFNELLQYYTMERFLFRLGASEHADRFVLKGALMLRVWDLPLARPTMDIDMLGRTPKSVDDLVEIIRQCLAVEIPDDGVSFDTKSVKGDFGTMYRVLPSFWCKPDFLLFIMNEYQATFCRS
jgi:Nucleotidyl transferase AbiEii toxin, Type IV TA system